MKAAEYKTLTPAYECTVQGYTVHSSAGIGLISSFIVRRPSFADHIELDQQVQLNCCYDAETGFLLLL